MGLKALPTQAEEELVIPEGKTRSWVEQAPESEQDSGDKTLSAVTQRGKTSSVTQGVAAISTVVTVPTPPWPHRASQVHL